MSASRSETIGWIAIPFVPKCYVEVIVELDRQSLIEKSSGCFTLQPVVMEYVTAVFIDRVCAEITTLDVAIFNSHALIQAQAKDYVRESQVRMILVPLVEQLLGKLRSKPEIKQQLVGVACLQDNRLLVKLRSEFAGTSSYAGGNLINLFRHLHIDSIGHTNWVRAMTFSPDCRTLASGSFDCTVRLWDVTTGECLQTFADRNQAVNSVVFSPDGNLLVSGSDNILVRGSDDWTIGIWDVNTGGCLKTVADYTEAVYSVALSPDGQTIASSSLDRTIRLWSTLTGECLQVLAGHTDWVTSVAFIVSPPMLVSASCDRTILFWNIQTGQCIRTLQGQQLGLVSIAVNPSGDILASGSIDHPVALWHINTGECVKILRSPRPYEGMDITGVTDITDARQATLKALGAVDSPVESLRRR